MIRFWRSKVENPGRCNFAKYIFLITVFERTANYYAKIADAADVVNIIRRTKSNVYN